ncbi:MAG: trypsin-like peptidase domain-containing protein, partial [Clostridia bacterium]|nr:trypsin-like peptidase domain-containing protein [Clostridia bacterium]
MKGQKKLVMSLIAACLFALGGIFLCSCAPQAQLPTFSVNENGELVALYPGGSSENLGKVTGSDGEKGEKGEKGEDGADGQGGISSATVNDSLKNAVSIQLIVEYSHRTGSFGPTTTNKMVFYGSGVIISLDKEQGDAYILTNAHVIYDGAFVQNGITYTPTSTPPTRNLYLYGMGYEKYEEQYAIPFTVVGYSKENDLAVLKVENSQILKNSVAQAAPIGNSDNILVGEPTYLVGNALGDGIAATTGVISVERERIDVLFADGTSVLTLDSIRTDAASNHGNSGGGMYNQKGELIGILFAGYNENGAQGMGNCLPINTVMGIANSIINNCNGATVNTKKADLGITLNL